MKSIKRLYFADPSMEWPKNSSLKWPDDLLCHSIDDLIRLLLGEPIEANLVYGFILRHQEAVKSFLEANNNKEEIIDIDFSMSREGFVAYLKSLNHPDTIGSPANNCCPKSFSDDKEIEVRRLHFAGFVCNTVQDLKSFLTREGLHENAYPYIADNLLNIRSFLEYHGENTSGLLFSPVGMTNTEIVNRIRESLGIEGRIGMGNPDRFITHLAPPVIVSRRDGSVSVSFAYDIKIRRSDTLMFCIVVFDESMSTFEELDKKIIDLDKIEHAKLNSFYSLSSIDFESRLKTICRTKVLINNIEQKDLRFFVETNIEEVYVSNCKMGMFYCNSTSIAENPDNKNNCFQVVSSFSKLGVARVVNRRGKTCWVNQQGKRFSPFFLKTASIFHKQGFAFANLDHDTRSHVHYNNQRNLILLNDNGKLKWKDFLDNSEYHEQKDGIVSFRSFLYNYQGDLLYDVKKHRSNCVQIHFADENYVCFSHKGLFGLCTRVLNYGLCLRNKESLKESDDYQTIKPYSGDYFAVCNYVGKWGFMTRDFQLSIPHCFDEAHSFSEGFAAVKRNDMWGFISPSLNETIKKYAPQLATEYYILAHRYNGLRDFSNGFAAVKKNGKWGFIHCDDFNQERIPCTFEEVGDFINGFAAVKTLGKWGFINTDGIMIVPPIFDRVEPEIIDKTFITGARSYEDESGTQSLKWGVFLLDGSEKCELPVEYEQIGLFSQGIAPAKFEGKWGYITPDGYPVEIINSEELAPESDADGHSHSSGVSESSSRYDWSLDSQSWLDSGFDYDLDFTTYP